LIEQIQQVDVSHMYISVSCKYVFVTDLISRRWLWRVQSPGKWRGV